MNEFEAGGGNPRIYAKTYQNLKTNFTGSKSFICTPLTDSIQSHAVQTWTSKYDRDSGRYALLISDGVASVENRCKLA